MPLEAPVIRTDLPLRSMSMERSLVELEDFACERGAHDLGGATGDQIAARAPPHRLDRHFGGQAHGAVKLHAAVGGFEAELGAVDLAHIGVVATGDALVDLPGRAVGEKLAG